MKLSADLPSYYSTAVQSGYNKKRLNAIPDMDTEIVELLKAGGKQRVVLEWISSLLLNVPFEFFPAYWLRCLTICGAYSPVESVSMATHIYIVYRDEVRSLPIPLFEIEGRRSFDYQYVRYIESEGEFVRLAPTKFEKHEALTPIEIERRRSLYGDPSYSTNLTLSRMSAFFSVLKEQLLMSPLTYFLIFCVSMWTITKYMTYTVLIVILVVIERSVAIRQSLQTWSHLSSVSSNADEQELTVLRKTDDSSKESKQTVRAKDLVPGDHIIITPNMYIPCDCVLIKGEVIADISFVTGESKATRSNAVPPGKGPARASSVASALLLCGSKVLRTRAAGGSLECRAVVVANGFHTLQGNFLLAVLFRDPSPAERRLEYWLVQAVAGLIGLAAACMIYTYFISTSYLHLHPVEITVRVFDLLTDALPPALPLSLSIAVLAASFRLPLYISSSRSGRPTHILAGLVNKVVLDKTNTVTTADMTVIGVLESDSAVVAARPTKGSDLELAMASCNYLAIVEGATLGDPLEVALMDSIGWEIDRADESFVYRKSSSPVGGQVGVLSPSLEQSPGSNMESINQLLRQDRMAVNSIQVVASFPFNPVTMRMSVVARLAETDKLWGVSKGAYEQIISKCDPDTVPFTLPETYDRLSSLGYRILAYSSRPLPQGIVPESVTREEVETGMRFCGIVLVSNQLHPNSKEAIRSLRQSNIQVYLCTGDSMGTAVAVARQAGITGPLQGIPPSRNSGGFMYEPLLNKGLSELVLARLTPDDKALFVEALAEKEKVGAVMMCGDGPNDANALCAADVGVVVNASPNPLLESAAGCMACLDPTVGLRAVVEIITLGRSAIATLLCIAEIVISYAVIEGTCVVLCYSVGDNLTDFQYAVVDMFIVLPSVLLIAVAARPAARIEDTVNVPPFKVKTIGLAFQCSACAVIQFIALEVLKAQDWYVPFRPSLSMMAGAHEWIHSTDDLTGLENTVLFIVCCFQCVLLIHIFTFRTLGTWCKSVTKSPIILIWLRITVLIVALQLVSTTALQETLLGQGVMQKMDLVPLQGTFIFQLAVLMAAQTLISCVWEFGVMPRLEREIVMNHNR
jgi:magnesium-transporting ATPase (P-type)